MLSRQTLKENQNPYTVYEAQFVLYPDYIHRYLPAAYRQVRKDNEQKLLEFSDRVGFKRKVAFNAFQMFKQSNEDLQSIASLGNPIVRQPVADKPGGLTAAKPMKEGISEMDMSFMFLPQTNAAGLDPEAKYDGRVLHVRIFKEDKKDKNDMDTFTLKKDNSIRYGLSLMDLMISLAGMKLPCGMSDILLNDASKNGYANFQASLTPYEQVS